jgi:hypothetical protein
MDSSRPLQSYQAQEGAFPSRTTSKCMKYYYSCMIYPNSASLYSSLRETRRGEQDDDVVSRARPVVHRLNDHRKMRQERLAHAAVVSASPGVPVVSCTCAASCTRCARICAIVDERKACVNCQPARTPVARKTLSICRGGVGGKMEGHERRTNERADSPTAVATAVFRLSLYTRELSSPIHASISLGLSSLAPRRETHRRRAQKRPPRTCHRASLAIADTQHPIRPINVSMTNGFSLLIVGLAEKWHHRAKRVVCASDDGRRSERSRST